MEVQLKRSEGFVEVDAIRIKIHDKEYLMKQGADGICVTEIGGETIFLRPQVANSFVIVTR